MAKITPRNPLIAFCGGLTAAIPAILLLLDDRSPHVVDFLGRVLLGFTLALALVAIWMWVPSEYEKLQQAALQQRAAALQHAQQSKQPRSLPIWVLRGLVSAAGVLIALAVVVFRQQPEHKLILALAGCVLLGALAYSWNMESVLLKDSA